MTRIITLVPLPFRIDGHRWPNDAGRHHRFPAARYDLRGFPQRANSFRRQRPIRRLRGDASAGAQHVAGDCQLMSGFANIASGVVEDKVLEVHKLAVNPK